MIDRKKLVKIIFTASFGLLIYSIFEIPTLAVDLVDGEAGSTRKIFLVISKVLYGPVVDASFKIYNCLLLLSTVLFCNTILTMNTKKSNGIHLNPSLTKCQVRYQGEPSSKPIWVSVSQVIRFTQQQVL